MLMFPGRERSRRRSCRRPAICIYVRELRSEYIAVPLKKVGAAESG